MKWACLIILMTCVAVDAQTTAPSVAAIAPTTSPVVNPDRTVTFHVRAPTAKEVTMTADWLPERTVANLTKDDSGIWSVTVGPLEPGIAIYNFNIDGMAIPDPFNPKMKLRAQTSASLVTVPGDGSEPFAVRDVPHGQVRIQYQMSKVLDGQTREFRVYTPPGYDETPSAKYPVMYLLHGTNDTAAGWTDVGQANYIMDNLIAQKKVVPMIVVMPWGHATPYRAPGAGGVGGPGGAGGGPNANTVLFGRYLLEDLIPTVDKTFRVYTDREHRALVGLSMGGEQSLSIGLNHPELFATVDAFSPSIPRDPETQFKTLLDGGAQSNAKIKLLWIGCGKQEPRFGSNEQFVKLLADHQISSKFVGLDGLHNYTLWRKFLAEMSPLMFRD